MNYLKNTVFKASITQKSLGSGSKYLIGKRDNNEYLAERYQHYQEIERLDKVSKNLDNVVASLLPERDAKRFKILSKYIHEDAGRSEVQPDQVREQLDRIQFLEDLKLIEANESAYDPDTVKYYKLRARVYLDEEGAEQELEEYLKTRPIVKPYTLYSDRSEKSRSLWQWWPF